MNTKRLTISSGNLFAVAAAQYGDAMLWTAIAQANGLTDPVVSGTVRLTIPPNPVAKDGILYS